MRQVIMVVAGVLFSAAAAASDSGISLSDAWARVTVPGQSSGSIQFSVRSDKTAKLVTVSSPVADSVEIHKMTSEGGMMRMRTVEFIELSAGKEISLEKSGYHVMLINLKQPLQAGDSIPFTLDVQFADKHDEKVEGTAEVRALHHNMHDMGGMGDMSGH